MSRPLRRRPTRKIERLELIDPLDVIGCEIKYHSWTERTKFLLESVDTIAGKIHGTYFIENKEIPNTTFNLCKGITKEKRFDCWYIVEDTRKLDFSLDDGLFEI